jgi:hypothetical protein
MIYLYLIYILGALGLSIGVCAIIADYLRARNSRKNK